MKPFNSGLICKNLGNNPSGKRVHLGIVLHDTAGSGTHNDTVYLANDPERRGISVDFTVERDGSIWKLNPDLSRYWTFHAGRATRWTEKKLAGPTVNAKTIGIEIVQKANLKLSPKWPDAQVQSVAELCFWLCEKFKLNKTDITTHKKIITDGSRSDPRDWPWELFWKYFNAAAKEASHTTLKKGLSHTVVDGDTLYSLAIKYATTIETIKALNNISDRSDTILVGQVLKVKL